MQGYKIREALHNGDRVFGTHFTGASNPLAIHFFAAAKLDFVFICSEHMPMDRAELSKLCHLFMGNGISPVVRISEPSRGEATCALDGGAQGIVVPYIESVEQVQELVSAVHYRPLKGKILDEVLAGKRTLNDKTADYLKQFNKEKYAIIGIESIPAYENLDALLEVQGVDGVFVGPHDLSVSMGMPEEWDNPEYIEVLEDIVRRCRKAGVGVGIHLPTTVFSIERMRRFVDIGMNWMLCASDVMETERVLPELFKALGRHSDSDMSDSGEPRNASEMAPGCAALGNT